MITNWISTIRQIRVIVAIDFRDVEDLLIVTYFKARESVGSDVVFILIYLSSGPKYLSIRRQRITRSVDKELDKHYHADPRHRIHRAQIF